MKGPLKVVALYKFWAFLKLINYKGGPENFSDIHHRMARFLSRHQDIIDDEDFDYNDLSTVRYADPEGDWSNRLMIVPRGHLKTTLKIGYILWRIYRNPNIRVLIGCDDITFAKGIMRVVMQYLQSSELQEKVWHSRPHIRGLLVPVVEGSSKYKYGKDVYAQQIAQKIVWSQSGFQVIRPDFTQALTVTPTSVGTTSTGDHVDLFIGDDLVNFQNSKKVEAAEKIIEWESDMYSVVDPQREVIVSEGGEGLVPFKELVGDEYDRSGTPYFAHDLYAYLISNRQAGMKVFHKNIYVNGKDNTDGYLWPEVWNEKYEAKVRGRIKSAKKFSSQYLCTHISHDSVQLPPEQINILARPNIGKNEYGDVTINLQGNTSVVRCIVVIDPAASLSETADNTALGVITRDFYGNVCLLDGRKGKYTPRQAYEIACELGMNYGCSKAIIESGVALQEAYVRNFQAFMQEPGRYKMACTTYTPRGDKKDNIFVTLSPVMEVGKLWMVESCFRLAEMELIYFPDESAKDDFIDMVHIGIKHLRGLGRVASSEPQGSFRHIRLNTRYGGIG